MKHVLTLSVLCGALFATGCTRDERADFRILSDAPASVEINSEIISLPAGVAVGVKAFALIDDERRGDKVGLIPKRTNIVGIEHGLEERTFVIWGINPGSTAVEVYFDGDYVGDMPAVVEAQNPQR